MEGAAKQRGRAVRTTGGVPVLAIQNKLMAGAMGGVAEHACGTPGILEGFAFLFL